MERAVRLAAESDVAVIVAGLNPDWESEGYDRRSLDLPGEQNELIRRLAEANPRTVVVINAGCPVAMPWVDQVGAIVQAWYPGQEGGGAIADVLFGVREPGGRLPTTFARAVEDHPSHATYPGADGRVVYEEGLLVGYRAFDTLGRDPLFPFGHGLSYTTFEYGPVMVDRQEFGQGEAVTVTVGVRNTGNRTGSEVVQVYVRDMESTQSRPDKELKGFAKVRLEPGEERAVSIVLEPRAFQTWHPGGGWVAEPGDFEVVVGASSRDVRGTARVRLTR
jgi:beta-glucosidase